MNAPAKIGDFHVEDIRLRKLERRTGPRLADGTLFSDLFDLEKREISLRVMNDAEIHAIEMKRIYGRAWVALGHVSEIPNAGDFMLRKIGEDPVIVTRGRDGEVRLMLNACTHRGMEVCFAERGNTKSFRCPYHAWIFDLDGSLLGVPYEKTMMGENWDKSALGLPRVSCEVRHGLIYGNLSENPSTLEAYFGDMLWYFDEIYGGTEMIAVRGGSGRKLIHANWKTNWDQSNGDFLHVVGTHHDLVELKVFAEDFGQFSTKVTTPPNGHFLALFEPNFGDTEAPAVDNQTQEVMDKRKNLPIGQRGSALSLYPGTTHFHSMIPLPDGSMIKFANIVTPHPHGVDRFEFGGDSLMLLPKGTPQEVVTMFAQSPATRAQEGIGANDSETWRSITQAASHPVTAGRAKLRYPSAGAPFKPEGWEGPGMIYDGFSTDDTQWHAWLHYFDLMTIDEAA